MKNTIQFLTTITLIGFLLTACSPTIHYLGNDYQPTQNVDIYFDENDIEKEYRVIGTMKNEGEQWANDIDKIKTAMIEKAKAKGADAILFAGAFSEKVSSVQTGEYSKEGKNKDQYTFNNAEVQHVKIVEAKVLKYRS